MHEQTKILYINKITTKKVKKNMERYKKRITKNPNTNKNSTHQLKKKEQAGESKERGGRGT